MKYIKKILTWLIVSLKNVVIFILTHLSKDLVIHAGVHRSLNIVRVIKSRRLRWAGHVARMEEGRSAFKILTGKPRGKRPLGTPRRRWEDNIRMDLEEIGINAKNWLDSAQDRCYWRVLVNPKLNLRVHKPWS